MDIPWVFKFLYEHSPALVGLVFVLVAMATQGPGDPFGEIEVEEKEKRLREALDLIDRFEVSVSEFREQLVDLGFELGQYSISPTGSLKTPKDIGYAVTGMGRMLVDIGALLKELPDELMGDEAGDDG